MLFADDVVLVDKSRVGANRKVELRTQTLKCEGLEDRIEEEVRIEE